ncbi:CheY-like chemotaxis protein [Catenulispora sp. GAS73]|uniref:response regulator n=1 Tax=Catenulispora sp. GAS73 TaxID=3156269 RepID=UPI003514E8F6
MAQPAEHRRDPAPDAPRHPDASGPPRFAGQKVLIVDDDRRGAFALGSALSARGLTVVQAATGPDGLAAVEHDPTIRAVLLDIALPGLDGYATAARIRELDHGAATPIIAVTFEASNADRAKALAAGMDEHVPKPVDVPRLLRVLAELLN